MGIMFAVILSTLASSTTTLLAAPHHGRRRRGGGRRLPLGARDALDLHGLAVEDDGEAVHLVVSRDGQS